MWFKFESEYLMRLKAIKNLNDLQNNSTYPLEVNKVRHHSQWYYKIFFSHQVTDTEVP